MELNCVWTPCPCSITAVTHLFTFEGYSSNWCYCLFYSVDTVEAAFSLAPDEFKAKYGVAKPQLDSQELVFHCFMGGRGKRATDAALKLGYVK